MNNTTAVRSPSPVVVFLLFSPAEPAARATCAALLRAQHPPRAPFCLLAPGGAQLARAGN